METKPFSLQSPESIAKEYGGNKQKIAQAMQMGILDPTAGTLAGMFIDRMRSAQMQEQAPQQTVAQQVFNPQPPPPPASPPGGAPPPGPPMGAPPPMMGAAPPTSPPGPPMEGPPPGMAMGGIAGLPIPSSMFDEPDNSGYSRGGIVAFAEGAKVQAPQSAQEQTRQLAVIDPDEIKRIMGEREALLGRKTKYSDMQREAYEKELTPEAMEARRKRDMWATLAQIGAKMAQTPGSFLQATSAGIQEALPAAQQMAKERRADKRAMVDALAAQEGADNKQRAELMTMSLNEIQTTRQLVLEGVKLDQAMKIAQLQADTDIRQANISAGATIRAAGINASALEKQARAQAFQESEKTRAWIRELLKENPQYRRAVSSGDWATARSIEDAAMAEAGIPVYSSSGAPMGGGGGNPSVGSKPPPGTQIIN